MNINNYISALSVRLAALGISVTLEAIEKCCASGVVVAQVSENHHLHAS